MEDLTAAIGAFIDAGGASSMRVVLAEDGLLLREGLAGLLGRFGFQVVTAVVAVVIRAIACC